MEGLMPVASMVQTGLMDTTHVRALGDGFVINGGSGIKGRYVKLFTINKYNGTIAFVEMSSYGNGANFYIALNLGVGTQNIIAFKEGKVLLGSLGGFRFFVVGMSVYMFVPSSSLDCYVFISSRMGTVHSNGKDISESIDTSSEIHIS